MILIKIALGVIAAFVIFHLLTRSYLNPYKLYMVFGKKGSGKTTLLVRLAVQHINKGWHVYSTEDIAVPGVRKFDVSMVGKKSFDHNSLVLIDEVGMVWDSRDFKNFPVEVRDWFKLQRHYRCKVYLFSQSFDIDKKLRDLTDGLYLCSTKLRVFSWAKRIHRSITLTKSEAERESHISEDLEFDSILTWPFGGRILTWIPKYAKYFDSHVVPELHPMRYSTRIPALEGKKHSRFRPWLNKTTILLRSVRRYRKQHRQYFSRSLLKLNKQKMLPVVPIGVEVTNYG